MPRPHYERVTKLSSDEFASRLGQTLALAPSLATAVRVTADALVDQVHLKLGDQAGAILLEQTILRMRQRSKVEG
jgi:hypothetical protein